MGGYLEEFWEDMLSEEPLRVAAAWATLDGEEREAVYAHLQRMATESGWAEVQRQAAQAALDVLRDDAPNTGAAQGGA